MNDEKLQEEILRVEKLNAYENQIYASGVKFIAGIDEVGRGPLAGPVYACAVILPPDLFIPKINDSKKLTPRQRQIISEQIKKQAIDFAFGIVDEKVIDQINIYNATCLAMQKAIENLKIKPDFLLIDAMELKNVDIEQLPIVKGDTLSISIAAASILAKVERDNFMISMHDKYPQYFFDKNKGYGTKVHIQAIKDYGICPLHRKSFLKNILPGECLLK